MYRKTLNRNRVLNIC